MLKVTTTRGRSATSARSGPDLRAVPIGTAASHPLDRLRLRLSLVRDERPQLLAGLEDGHRTCRDFDRIARAGVPSHAGLSTADLERPESANLDVVLLLERV